MQSTADYRRYAAQCLDLAERASPQAREGLLKMAESWVELAMWALPRTEPDQNAPSTDKLQ
jgi:hypothetical protein